MVELKVLYEPISILLSYNEYLVNQLVRLGLEIYVDKPGQIFADLFYVYEKLKGRFKGMFLPTYLMPGFLRFKYLERYLKRVDLLHLNGFNLPIDVLRRFKKMGKPVVFVLHTAPLNRNIYSVLNEVVDLYIAPSYFTLNNEINKLGKRAIVIRHGIDVEEFKPIPKPLARAKLSLPKSTKKIILWNDRISPEKDLETFLRAIPLVLKECKECYFYIKGRAIDRNYWQKLKPLLKTIPSSSLQLHVGWISHSKLPYLYSAADVFVRTQRYENFGLAFVEAMACGTPVIASDAATAREVIGDSGLLYREGDFEDLADKILTLLKDKSLQEELSCKARDRVLKYFTAERMAREYLAIYRELIG